MRFKDFYILLLESNVDGRVNFLLNKYFGNDQKIHDFLDPLGGVIEFVGTMVGWTADSIQKAIKEMVELIVTVVDPTKGKYSDWIIKNIIKMDFNTIRLFGREDWHKVAEDLLRFKTYGRLFKNYVDEKGTNYSKYTDINAFNNFSHLWEMLSRLRDIISDEEEKEKLKRLSKQIEKIYESEEWLILIPLTKEASCAYGANTRWCTASKNHNYFEAYDAEGPLYIIIDKIDNNKWQLHYGKDGKAQEMNALDGSFNVVDFLGDNPELEDPITSIWEKHYKFDHLLTYYNLGRNNNNYKQQNFEKFIEKIENADLLKLLNSTEDGNINDIIYLLPAKNQEKFLSRFLGLTTVILTNKIYSNAYLAANLALLDSSKINEAQSYALFSKDGKSVTFAVEDWDNLSDFLHSDDVKLAGKVLNGEYENYYWGDFKYDESMWEFLDQKNLDRIADYIGELIDSGEYEIEPNEDGEIEKPITMAELIDFVDEHDISLVKDALETAYYRATEQGATDELYNNTIKTIKSNIGDDYEVSFGRIDNPRLNFTHGVRISADTTHIINELIGMNRMDDWEYSRDEDSVGLIDYLDRLAKYRREDGPLGKIDTRNDFYLYSGNKDNKSNFNEIFDLDGP